MTTATSRLEQVLELLPGATAIEERRRALIHELNSARVDPGCRERLEALNAEEAAVMNVYRALDFHRRAQEAEDESAGW